MGDIKLFQIANNQVSELSGQSVTLEKSLQTLIESHLEALLGVRFLASEYSTGKKHSGRIDTLGIDENGFPVIIEYKRSLNENVINQGLFYMSWLLDHRAEFELMVIKKLGQAAADQIDWSNPRLLCIAGDFTKYDEHAVQQINRTIELLRYRKYGDELLLIELVNAVSGSPLETRPSSTNSSKSNDSKRAYKTVADYLDEAPEPLKNLYFDLEAQLFALGDDVQKKELKYYFAYKRLKNFACVELRPQTNEVIMHIKVDPDSVELESGFTRDMRGIGHFGTGDLEVRIQNQADLLKAQLLIKMSYDQS